MNHNETSGAGTSGAATESHGGAHSMKGMGQGSNGPGAGVHAQERGGTGMSVQNSAGKGAQTHGQTQTGRTGTGRMAAPRMGRTGARTRIG
jgi:hypothetical protein